MVVPFPLKFFKGLMNIIIGVKKPVTSLVCIFWMSLWQIHKWANPMIFNACWIRSAHNIVHIYILDNNLTWNFLVAYPIKSWSLAKESHLHANKIKQKKWKEKTKDLLLLWQHWRFTCHMAQVQTCDYTYIVYEISCHVHYLGRASTKCLEVSKWWYYLST